MTDDEGEPPDDTSEEADESSEDEGFNLPTPLPKPLVEVLDAVPKEQREAVLSAFIQISEYHRGPLPRVRDFAGYEGILPGSANRIMSMAEKEQDNRHKIANKIVDGERRYGTRGQWLAGIFFVLLIAAGFYVIAIKGNNIGGGIILGATTLTVVVAFLGRQFSLFSAKENADDDEDS